MELLFQAWDEVDDLLAALRQLFSRYLADSVGDVRIATSAALVTLRRSVREAARARRRSPRTTSA